MKRLALIAMGLLPVLPTAALTVVEDGSSFKVMRGTRTVVSALALDFGVYSVSGIRNSFEQTADGTKVWNRWSENKDGRFRLEVAAHTDGSVELSIQGEADCLCNRRGRKILLTLPGEYWNGQTGRYICTGSRSYEDRQLAFDADFTDKDVRWAGAGGVTLDFSPVGAGDYFNVYDQDAMTGMGHLSKVGDDYQVTAGGTIRAKCGGYVGTKVVLREGGFYDYPRFHFLKSIDYKAALDATLHWLAFASPRRGEAYAEGDVAYAEETGFGWAGDPPRTAVIGHSEGALYSALRGEGTATYRFTGLFDGWYLFTFEAGNYTGEENLFDVSVAGTALATGVSVPERKARQISRAVHVTGGTADVVLSGRWLVSVIGVQPLMGDGEDYSVSRGFWVTDGYEPCSIYRNADWKAPFVPATADDTIDLPVPGTEFAGEPCEPPAPVELPEKDLPSLAWLSDASLCRLLENNGSLAELDDPAAMKRHLDDYTLGQGYNAAIVSGMHSRHTYLGNLERGRDALGRIATELHARGMKLIDHHDEPLLWNVHSGFRVLMERLPETMRTREGGRITHHFCPSNPDYAAKSYAYMRGLVEAGVDGFQLDEIEYYTFGCTCARCREAFRRDTGWSIPVNECNADWLDGNSRFGRLFYDWHRKMITNWFVGLRRYVKDLKPDLVLSMYTTHSGFTGSHPARSASSDLIDMKRTVNLFGNEVMCRKVMKCSRSILPNRRMANILREDGVSACWGWYYNSDWQNDYVSWILAQMTGQSALLSGYLPPADGPQYPAWAGSGEKMPTKGVTPVCETVLLFSAYSRDWNPGFSFQGELFGTAQALEALHVPYRFMSDAELEKGVPGGTKLLFVGTSSCLSDAEIAAIRAFAERGGKVRLSGLAGLYDEFGGRRASWPFADVFGFEPTEQAGSSAAIVTKTLGAGSLVYCPNARGAPFEELELERDWTKRYNPDPAKEAAFWQEIAGLASGATWWTCAAPAKVYTSVWRESRNRVAIHFYNATGVNNDPNEDVTPEAPDPAFPALAEDIVFTVPFADITAATASSPDFDGVRDLPFVANADGTATVTLSKELLTAYTLVRLSSDLMDRNEWIGDPTTRSGAWSDPSCWSLGRVPRETDYVIFPEYGGQDYTVTVDGEQTAGLLKIGDRTKSSFDTVTFAGFGRVTFSYDKYSVRAHDFGKHRNVVIDGPTLVFGGTGLYAHGSVTVKRGGQLVLPETSGSAILYLWSDTAGLTVDGGTVQCARGLFGHLNSGKVSVLSGRLDVRDLRSYKTTDDLPVLAPAGGDVAFSGSGRTMSFALEGAVDGCRSFSVGAGVALSLSAAGERECLSAETLTLGSGASLNLTAGAVSVEAGAWSVSETAAIVVTVPEGFEGATAILSDLDGDAFPAALVGRIALQGDATGCRIVNAWGQVSLFREPSDRGIGTWGAYEWTGAGGDGLSRTAENWFGGAAPTDSDSATFGGSTKTDVSFNGSRSGGTLQSVIFRENAVETYVIGGTINLTFGNESESVVSFSPVPQVIAGYPRAGSYSLKGLGGAPVVLNSNVASKNKSSETYYLMPQGEVQIGANALTIPYLYFAALAAPPERPTRLTLRRGAALTVTHQRRALNPGKDPAGFRIGEGASLVFADGDGEAKYEWDAVPRRLVVNGLLDIRIPYASARNQAYGGSGRIRIPAGTVAGGNSTRTTFGDALDVTLGSWNSENFYRPNPSLNLTMLNSISVRGTPVLHVADGWRYGPEAGMTPQKTAADRALEIPAPSVLTLEAGGGLATIDDAVTGGGTLLITNGILSVTGGCSPDLCVEVAADAAWRVSGMKAVRALVVRSGGTLAFDADAALDVAGDVDLTGVALDVAGGGGSGWRTFLTSGGSVSGLPRSSGRRRFRAVASESGGTVCQWTDAPGLSVLLR